MPPAGYTTRQPLPYMIELGRDTVLTVPVYLNGALKPPTAGTVSVYDDNNTAIVAAAEVMFTGEVAQYTVAGSSTSNRSPSGNWRVEWTLTVPGAADDVVFREEAYLVRNVLRPVISDIDVGQRMPPLRIGAAGGLTTASSHQGSIQEADILVQSRLIELGRRPWLIVSPSALRETWLCWTIAIIFDGLGAASGSRRDGGGGGDDPYSARAEEWRERGETAFGRARLAFDWADDGQADTGGRVGPRPGAVWLC